MNLFNFYFLSGSKQKMRKNGIHKLMIRIVNDNENKWNNSFKREGRRTDLASTFSHLKVTTIEIGG